MEQGEPEAEDTVVVHRDADTDLDRTIVRPRRRARLAVGITDGADEAPDETIVVERFDDSAEQTIVIDRSSEASEQTIVVDRSSKASEQTIVVDRSSEASEQTIVVDRRPKLLGIDDDDDDDTDRSAARPPGDIGDDDTDRTVARPRDDDDATITVDRSTPSVKLPPVPSLRRARVQRRRGIAPPPVPVGFAPAARAAVGPGAIDHYSPRALTPAPATRPAPEGGVVPTRVIDPGLPSVARRAHRTAVVALAAFVGACAVSVTGLTLIALWVF